MREVGLIPVTVFPCCLFCVLCFFCIFCVSGKIFRYTKPVLLRDVNFLERHALKVTI